MTTRGDKQADQLSVQLPGSGHIRLQNADEVQNWNESMARYISDYGISKQNDRVLLGALLSQGLAMFRAQQLLTDPENVNKATAAIQKASEEIRNLERALGIDKKTREQGGKDTVDAYIEELKRAAHLKGIRIAERVKAHERIWNEATWKIRVLRNGDAEDRRYHGLTEKAIIDWLADELEQVKEDDKTWAKEKGAVFVGRV